MACLFHACASAETSAYTLSWLGSPVLVEWVYTKKCHVHAGSPLQYNTAVWIVIGIYLDMVAILNYCEYRAPFRKNGVEGDYSLELGVTIPLVYHIHKH